MGKYKRDNRMGNLGGRLDPGDELVKCWCPSCDRRYQDRLRYADKGKPTYLEHYGRCYELVCQECTDRIAPRIEPLMPVTRNQSLRDFAKKGFEKMYNGRTEEANSHFLFVIAQVLLDLHEAEEDQLPGKVQEPPERLVGEVLTDLDDEASLPSWVKDDE